MNRDVRGACPLDCPDTCSWIVTVRNGEPIQLRGDPHHQYTRGALCNKVVDYLDYTRSADRLLHPMRRVGPKGSGEFTRISWKEALERIANGLEDAIDAHGAESIWPFIGSGNMGLIQGVYGSGDRFWNLLGASRHVYNLCTIAGGCGTGYTLGDNRIGMDPETFKFSKLIVLWGANVLSTHPHLWRPILEARKKNGAHIIAIDPIRTRTAKASDGHLAPLPGTDAALALGLLNVVVNEGKQDERFINAHTLGWEAFLDRILEFPPSRAEGITGVPADKIVELGRRLAETRPTGIRIGIGLQRHGGGGMAVRTISCIPGVTGDWQYPGGGAFYDTRGFFGLNWAAVRREDLRTRATRALYASKLGDTLLEADPPVKVLFVYAANPMASAPRQSKVRAGLAREDLFTVVVEHFLTDTARYADIILPATMQTEHRDLLISYGHLYVAWNEPATTPRGECLPTTEIFRRLAHTLGIAEQAVYESDEAIAGQILASGHPSLEGITLDALKRRGSIRLCYPDPYVPFRTGFPTPSGKLEFVSERMAKEGLDPVAGYTLPRETAQTDTELAREYPLALITPANHYFLNSIFANRPRQRLRSGVTTVVIHPCDASPHIRTGDEVRVTNARGSFHAIAEVDECVRRGVIASTKGSWPCDSTGGSTVNATVDDHTSDMGAGALYHDNRVRIEKVHR